MKNWQDALVKISNDASLDRNEKAQKSAEVTAKYQEILEGYAANNIQAQQDLQASVMDLYGVTAEEADKLLDSMIPEMNSSAQTMIDTINEQGFKTLAGDVTTKLKEASVTYEDEIKAALKAGGESLDSIKAGTAAIDKTLTDEKIYWEGEAADAKSGLEETKKIYTTLKDLYDKFIASDKFDAITGSVETAEENLKKALEGLDDFPEIKDYEDLLKEIKTAIGNIKVNNTTVNNYNGGSTGGGDSSGNTSYKKRYYVEHGPVAGTYTLYVSKGAVANEKFSGNSRDYEKKVVGSSDNIKQLLGKDYKGYARTSDALIGFSTGGYTGDWASSDGNLQFFMRKSLYLTKRIQRIS